MTDRSTPRLTPLAAEDRTAEQQRLIDAVGSELAIFTTLVRHPELFGHFQRFAGRLLQHSGLPPTVREILILRTAFRCRSGYEWVQHVRIAGQVGLPPEVVAQLDADDPQVDEATARLVRAADELTTDHYLQQPTWDELGRTFDEHQMMEICFLVGNYAMIAGVLRSLQVQVEDGGLEPDWAC